jgi:hypothetical protein
MDPQRFDGLVRSLARASTRRDLTRAAAASFVGAFLAAIGAGSTAAQPWFCASEGSACNRPCCRGLRCRDGRCQRCRPLGDWCLSGRECCGGAFCERDVVLGLGRCRCPAGQTACNGVCRDLRSDPFSCGSCFNQCLLFSQTCDEGRCCTPTGQACSAACSDNQPCPGCCQGFCHGVGGGRRGRCGCPPGTRDCGGVCIPAHECCTDTDCGAGLICRPESRTCGCPGSARNCGGFCRPAGSCCANAECPAATPNCVEGVCLQCPGGEHFECRTFEISPFWCDDETFCRCIPDGTFICGPRDECAFGTSCSVSLSATCVNFYGCE